MSLKVSSKGSKRRFVKRTPGHTQKVGCDGVVAKSLHAESFQRLAKKLPVSATSGRRAAPARAAAFRDLRVAPPPARHADSRRRCSLLGADGSLRGPHFGNGGDGGARRWERERRPIEGLVILVHHDLIAKARPLVGDDGRPVKEEVP